MDLTEVHGTLQMKPKGNKQQNQRVDCNLHIKIQAQLWTSKVDKEELLVEPRWIAVQPFTTFTVLQV